MSIPLITWLWLVLAITLETIGTVSLKSSREFTVLVPSLIVFFCLCGVFLYVGVGNAVSACGRDLRFLVRSRNRAYSHRGYFYFWGKA